MENESTSRLEVVVGLGSNLGTPELLLRSALQELAALGEILAVSSLYRSLPVGGPPQPPFLNAAVLLRYAGAPRALLEALFAVERAMGRERRERWGPRRLDLDMLWAGALQLQEPDLVLPHPRLRERAFALQPLLDVAPGARDPADGGAYSELLERLGRSGIAVVAHAQFREGRWSWGGGPAADLPGAMDRPGS